MPLDQPFDRSQFGQDAQHTEDEGAAILEFGERRRANPSRRLALSCLESLSRGGLNRGRSRGGADAP